MTPPVTFNRREVTGIRMHHRGRIDAVRERRIVRWIEPEVLMIGDNLKTDILRASRRDFGSLMVLEGGVHGSMTEAELAAASIEAGVSRPT